MAVIEFIPLEWSLSGPLQRKLADCSTLLLFGQAFRSGSLVAARPPPSGTTTEPRLARESSWGFLYVATGVSYEEAAVLQFRPMSLMLEERYQSNF